MSLNLDIDMDIMRRRRRAYTISERRADCCIHIVGIAAAVIGAIVMVALARHDNAAKLSSVLIYTIGLLTMLSASAAYNMSCDFARPPSMSAILRRCDHSAILLMIAATFTPFAMKWSGWHAVATMWLAVAAGIAFKWLSPSFFERCSVALFLALAWIASLTMWPFGADLPPGSLMALVAGGALFTFGVLFHLWDNLPYQNAIWHGFVLAGAICHYIAILKGVVIQSHFV